MAKKSTSKLFEEDTTSVSDNNDIIDVDLSVIRKKRVRFNGDDSKIIELNTSDMGIASRLQKAYNELNDLMEDVVKEFNNLPDDAGDFSSDDHDNMVKALEDIDLQMREKIDYIFNAPVSEVLVGNEGSMWDPLDGAFRYEHIIDKIAALYESNLSTEFSKMRSKVNGRLAEYRKTTSKYHK